MVLAMGFGLNGTLIVVQVASIVASIGSYIWLRKLMASHPRVTPRYEVRVVMRFASVSWLSSVAQQGLVWADIVILGLFLPASSVGVYQVATRIVLVGAVATQALNASLAPRAADLFQRQHLETLKRLYVTSSEWLVRLTLPLMAFLFVCTKPVLRLFGAEFVAGVTVTRILIIGTIVDAATTQGGIVLNMSGRNAMNMVDTVAALVLNVGLNVILIPHLGINGASLAWALSLFLIGVLRAAQVKRYVINAWPLSLGVTKSFVAAAVSMVVAIPVAAALPHSWGFLLVAPLILAVYLVVLIALGMDEDDRLILNEMLSRFRPQRSLHTAA
jgi:O-antigen/teichoic acid export membrane protein